MSLTWNIAKQSSSVRGSRPRGSLLLKNRFSTSPPPPRSPRQKRFSDACSRAIQRMQQSGAQAAQVVHKLRTGEDYVNDAFRVTGAAYNLYMDWKKEIKRAFECRRGVEFETLRGKENETVNQSSPPVPVKTDDESKSDKLDLILEYVKNIDQKMSTNSAKASNGSCDKKKSKRQT